MDCGWCATGRGGISCARSILRRSVWVRNRSLTMRNFRMMLTYIYKEKGRAYYVDLESRVCFDSKPQLVKIGFMQFQKDGDLYFPFDPRLSGRTPYRRGEIVGGEDICFLGSHIVVLKDNPSVFYIRKRYSDGKRFVLSTSQTSRPNEPLYDLYYNGRVEMRKR